MGACSVIYTYSYLSKAIAYLRSIGGGLESINPAMGTTALLFAFAVLSTIVSELLSNIVLRRKSCWTFFFFSESHHPPTACVLGCLDTFSSQGISESAQIALLMFGFHVVTIGLLCLGSAFYIFSNTNTFYENVSFTVLKKLSA